MADFQNFAALSGEHNTALPTLSNEEASALQLDSSGRLIITTSGASIDVTATDLDIRNLSASQDNVAISDGTDTLAINADGSINVTEANSADILTSLQLIDNLVHLEDAAHASGDAGVMPLAVRVDTPGSLGGTDGDYVPFQMDATGNLRVTLASGSVGTGAEKAEDAAHVSGDIGNFVLAVANHTEGALHSADGDYAALQVDSLGRLRVAADISVVTGHEKAEDAAHASGDIGSYILSVREDTLAASTSADGDYQSLKTDGVGALWVKHNGDITIADGGNSITVDGSVSVSNFPATQTVDNAGTFAVQEDGAALTALQLIDNIVLLEDSASAGGEAGVQALAVRQDTLANSVSADGDFASLKVNATGALYVIDTAAATVGTEADASTDSASDGLLAIGAGITDILQISVAAGTTYHIKGWSGVANRQCSFKLEVIDTSGPTVTKTIRANLNSGAVPSFDMSFLEAIQVVGGVTVAIRVTALRLEGAAGLVNTGINGFVV